jgi:hypothetical protein
MKTRLHSKYPKLAERILSSPEIVPRVVAAAASVSFQSSDLQEPLGAVTMATLDSGEPLDVAVRTRLQEMQEESDNSYLDAQDALGPTETLSTGALREFRRARALAALLAAVGCRDGAQATEVVYEALASSEDEKAAFETIAVTTV